MRLFGAKRREEGSALTEAAIIFPCLMLIVYWSAALTDIMVLKLKAAEALRYALWETTVWKSPAQINSEVNAKFVDLASPRDMTRQHTGLLMYPLAVDMQWGANVDTTSTRLSLGGNAPNAPTNGLWDKFLAMLAGVLAKGVDIATNLEKFNVHGVALARVTLVHARHDEQASPILKGGDLLGMKGGNDLDHSASMTNFTFQAPLPSERPMQMVFDTWKAWPKPAAYTRDGGGTNLNVAPSQTYPEVEKQVTAQVDKIAFFGLNSVPGLSQVTNLLGKILNISGFLLGGHPPNPFKASRMDDGSHGNITILPPERAAESWAPQRCQIDGSMVACPNQRVGNITGNSEKFLDSSQSLGNRVDRTRYTIPYKINTQYWQTYGGVNHDMNSPTAKIDGSFKSQLATNNEYVKTYQCRGHYFAGSTKAQETDMSKRYQPSCK